MVTLAKPSIRKVSLHASDASPALQGAIAGGGFGLIVGAILQLVPRLHSGSGVFGGGPQGLDQYVYFSLVQAIWRTGNGFTYEYPFSLFWPAPPVLLQLPLTVAAWIAKVIGLSLSFEFLRVVGAAGSGAALWVLAKRLSPSKLWRRWLLFACVFGGGWFSFGAVREAIRTAGIEGLTEWPLYVQRSMGAIYWWLPYLAQNVVYPLEATYHALVLGAFAALLTGTFRTALVLHLLTWFSNPFPAVSLSVPVWLWLLSRVLVPQGLPRRDLFRQLVGWSLVMAIGLGYYGPFLGQWDVLRELGRMHRVPLAPPPTPFQLLCLLSPFGWFFLWSFMTRATRRAVWISPRWRLLAIIVVSQFMFLGQFWVLGSSAIQPYHFNRGYLSMALGAIAVRCVYVTRRNRGNIPRWLKMLILTAVIDHAVFFARELPNLQPLCIIPRDVAALCDTLRSLPPDQIFITYDPFWSPYLAGLSRQIPYNMETTMIIPWSAERNKILSSTVATKPHTLPDLGVTLAIVSPSDSLTTALLQSGWEEVFRDQRFILLAAPQAAARRSPPCLPPPRP